MALMSTAKKLNLSSVLSSFLRFGSPPRAEIARKPLCPARYASSAAAAAAAPAMMEPRGMGEVEMFGVKDYEEYRRSLYGGITHKALLVDAVGTLVVPSQPMAQVPSRAFSLSLSSTSLPICCLITLDADCSCISNCPSGFARYGDKLITIIKREMNCI